MYIVRPLRLCNSWPSVADLFPSASFVNDIKNRSKVWAVAVSEEDTHRTRNVGLLWKSGKRSANSPKVKMSSTEVPDRRFGKARWCFFPLHYALTPWCTGKSYSRNWWKYKIANSTYLVLYGKRANGAAMLVQIIVSHIDVIRHGLYIKLRGPQFESLVFESLERKD